MSIEHATIQSQQTRHQRSENTADTMNGRCTYGVVDMQTVVDKLNGEYENDTTYQTDDDGTQRTYKVATSRNAYQSSQHTIERQRE